MEQSALLFFTCSFTKVFCSIGLCLFSPSLWSITAKNTDCSTGPLACPFIRSLAPLTRSLAPDCSLRSRPPLRSLVCSLAHFAHSLAHGTVNDWMAILSVFFSIFDHSASVEEMISICYHFRTMNINTILIDF